MTLKNLLQEIEKISNNFELDPLTKSVKILKEDFDIDSISTPKHYWEIIEEVEKILSETRLLYLISVFNRVCEEEGKLYYFDIPYQANMKYSAVLKKEGNFYLLDEDGDYSDIFTSEAFVHFIDDLYWELYELE